VPQESVSGVEAFADRERPRRAASRPRETKPFFLTSEFLVLALAILGLLAATLATDAIDIAFFWVITAALVAAYAISRGFAKTGSVSTRSDRRGRRLRSSRSRTPPPGGRGPRTVKWALSLFVPGA
jgi:hypothetical protein